VEETGVTDGERLNALSNRVIGACIEVHKVLGPGLLESAYEECLAHELRLAGLPFARQKPLPIVYKGVTLDCDYRIDVLVDGILLVELKAVDELLPVHFAQVQTYLRLANLRLGLLVDFKRAKLNDGGIRRVVHGFPVDEDSRCAEEYIQAGIRRIRQ
jgi:GxxExxY protein